MPPPDPHAEWLGNIQPEGLLVNSAVLQRHGVVPDMNTARLAAIQRQLSAALQAPAARPLLSAMLGWQEQDMEDGAGHAGLIVQLPETGTTIGPDLVVPDPGPGQKPQLLVRWVPDGAAFDTPQRVGSWQATPHHLMTRLLQGTGCPTGILLSASALRLLHLPTGEAMGHATFPLVDMTDVAGRAMLAGLRCLLEGEARLFGDPDRRLSVLLRDSRRHQAEVSGDLSRQGLAALHALLRGLHAADRRAGRDRVAGLALNRPDHLYGGLLTTLMRLVFVLYAEDRGLFPDALTWRENYSLGGLFDRLQDDEARYPDTMEDRFGAWCQILALCRIVHGGATHGALRLPARRGALFDPDRFPFLEGRDDPADRPDPPRVSDATVLAILRGLLVLRGQRLLYSVLDVEQIGAVYETMMGFTVKLTGAPSVAIKSGEKSGASTVIELPALLALASGKRAGWLKENAERKPAPGVARQIAGAGDLAALEAALGSLVDRDATPAIVPAGTPVLQPTPERRRTGSHYTPPRLTRPIVADTLRPVLARLSPEPSPEAILALRIVDPAMGSGAFLVEACRQLAAHLVAAWARTGATPQLPSDQDALEHARRLVAVHCLCGVDRNPFAVEMARLSLWLATLARDHEFTFLDHALRHGDALIGLDRASIAALRWTPEVGSAQLALPLLRGPIARAAVERRRIRDTLGEEGEAVLRPLLERADSILDPARAIGDAVCATFFAHSRGPDRNRARGELEGAYLSAGQTWLRALEAGPAMRAHMAAEGQAWHPFHWDIEFPEVFERDNPGFDAVLGNPPYAGKNTTKQGNAPGFPEWLQAIHPGAHGAADLSAHFFRRGYTLLRQGGCLGFVATNTIAQGDTRESGLRLLLRAGATIVGATRRIRWPGDAAVVVCVVQVLRGPSPVTPLLDGREVPQISAFLIEGTRDESPKPLERSRGLAYQGSILLGMGFTFDDETNDSAANPVREMQRLTAPEHPRGAHNATRIKPYLGGEEVNDSPTHAHRRWAIDFEDFPLRRELMPFTWAEATPSQRDACLTQGRVPLDYLGPVAEDWPDLIAILAERVKPDREQQSREIRKRFWWKYGERAPALYNAIQRQLACMVISRVTPHLTIAHLPATAVFAESTVVFTSGSFGHFALYQSRVHEVWARFFSSSMKDDLRYAPSDCLETFPLPSDRAFAEPALAQAGQAFHDARAARMVAANEGLTGTHNRLDDPDERDPTILHLRTLHDEMDRAVLRAYGWPHPVLECVHEREWSGGEDDPPGPWRRRWPEADRARLLEFLWQLNEAEAATQGSPRSPPGASPRGRRPRRPGPTPLLPAPLLEAI
jgi:hypothetical protein